MEQSIISPELLVEITGILVAIISAMIFFDLKNSIGGRVGVALKPVIWGVFFNAAALGWVIFFTRLNLFPNAPKLWLDPHSLLMAVGMIFFLLAARKFILLKNPS